LVPKPSSDTERLREESLAELSPCSTSRSSTAASGPLIAAALAHLLEAWEGAVTGSEGPLEGLAGADRREALLRPSPGTRLVVRDAVLKSWEATRLDLSRDPPAIEVTLDLEAVRCVVRDNGSPVAGNRTDARQMALTWILELTDSTRGTAAAGHEQQSSQGDPGLAVL
jgi:hypothetical protein